MSARAEAEVPQPVFVFPASCSQERMWFLQQCNSTGTSILLNTVTELSTSVDCTVLEAAINEIVRRHEALRTTFEVIDGQVCQIVTAETHVALRVVDLRSLPEHERARAARDIADSDARDGFDLATGPLLRTTLIRTSRTRSTLLVTMHHIVADGWSMGVFWAELSTFWKAKVEGRTPFVPELAIQYPDYAVWQREALAAGAFESQISYWKRQLAGASATELLSDHLRPATQTFAGRTCSVVVAADVAAGIKAVARRHSTTPYVVMLAAFVGMLVRYTSDTDIVLGSYLAGRNRPEVEPLIGFFLNVVVLRCDANGDPSFDTLVDRVRQVVLDADANQDVPFTKVVEAVNPTRDLSRNALFQLMFQMLNVPTLTHHAGNDHEQPPPSDAGTAVFDMSWMIEPHNDHYTMKIEYNAHLFEAETIERLHGHYITMLRSAIAEPDHPLSRLELMEADERSLVADMWPRGRRRPQGAHRSLFSAFEEQVSQRPHDVAFFDATSSITYEQLSQRAAHLAGRLASSNVGSADLVAICLPRSQDLVVAVLAVVRLGAAYVAFEPEDPPGRVQTIVEDSRPRIIVASGHGPQPWAGSPLQVMTIDVDDAPVANPSPAPRESSDDDVIFMVYTSGSEGEPKGVPVRHGAVVNRLAWMWSEYPFGRDEVCCQRTPANFIDFAWEMFGPLLAGVPSLVTPTSLVRDVPGFVDALARARVTRLWVVPSLLRGMLEAFPDLAARLPELRFWVSSGEALTASVLQRFREAMPHAVLYNLYGTSEVWDATWWVPDDSTPYRANAPIGTPIDNVEAYVVDRELRPQPIGVPGELLIGGAGVAGGYLRRPELTARAFIANPFRPGTCLYRTGDLVRFLPGGVIDYLGRIDRQVKVRGGRVELAEVEAALTAHDLVADALVVTTPSTAGARLVAYYVARSGGATIEAELRAHLRARVPEYMVPSVLVSIERIPLSYNGKIDHSALPTAVEAAKRRQRPASRWEETVASIWRDVLEVDAVGTNENFFDVGGHSMLVIAVHARLARLTDGSISVTDLFANPTISDLARLCATVERRTQHVS